MKTFTIFKNIMARVHMGYFLSHTAPVYLKLQTGTVRMVFIVLIAGFVFACGSSRDVSDEWKLEVIEVTMVPDVTFTKYLRWEKPEVFIRILEDGSVAEVKFINPSGNLEWEAAAIDSIKKWRFSRLPSGSPPEGRTFRMALNIIQLHDPVFFTIGELWTPGKEIADSLFAELKTGADFLTMANQLLEDPSIDDTAFQMRTTNLTNYPEHVRNAVYKLEIGKYTNPVRVGDHYVIYMRFRDSEIHPPL